MQPNSIDMKVVGKGLVTKKETPTVTLKSSKGEKLTFHVSNPSDLDSFQMEQILTVHVSEVQKTLKAE